PMAQVLRMLEKRPLSAAYLAKSMPLADKVIRALERKRFIIAEDVQTERDPLRAPADRLRIELVAKPRTGTVKLNKPERELKAFLELHPGSPDLREREARVKNAGPAAGRRGREGLVVWKPGAGSANTAPIRGRPAPNPARRAGSEPIAAAVRARSFH